MDCCYGLYIVGLVSDDASIRTYPGMSGHESGWHVTGQLILRSLDCPELSRATMATIESTLHGKDLDAPEMMGPMSAATLTQLPCT